MRFQKITGIVLAMECRGENDKIITLLSSRMGKLKLIGRGLRRPRSRRSFHIDLFHVVELEVQETASGLYIREAVMREAFPKLSSSPEAFGAACCGAAFLMHTLPFQAHQKGLFALTHQLLSALSALSALQHETTITDAASLQIKKTLNVFLLKCMRTLGYLPVRIEKRRIRQILNDALDPQFTLYARRTLGMFSK